MMLTFQWEQTSKYVSTHSLPMMVNAAESRSQGTGMERGALGTNGKEKLSGKK